MTTQVQLMRYVTLAAAAVVVGVYMIGQAVNARLSELEIRTVAKPAPRAKPADQPPRTFYPVLIERQASGQPQAPSMGGIDTIFSTPVVKQVADVVAAPAKTPRDQIFLETLKVSGRAHNGVFLGSGFYQPGELVEELAFLDSDGVRVVPRLTRIERDALVFDLAGDRVSIPDGVGRAGR